MRYNDNAQTPMRSRVISSLNNDGDSEIFGANNRIPSPEHRLFQHIILDAIIQTYKGDAEDREWLFKSLDDEEHSFIWYCRQIQECPFELRTKLNVVWPNLDLHNVCIHTARKHPFKNRAK